MIARLTTTFVVAISILNFIASVRAEIGGLKVRLVPDESKVRDGFGKSVALGEKMALVGAPGSEFPAEKVGAAYLFDVSTGQQYMKLSAPDEHIGNRFGFSVAISGNRAIVGAINDDRSGDGSGAAYVFDAETGQELMKLTPSDTSPGDYFGWSVSVSGNIALIGASGNDYSHNNTGAAYLFDITTGHQLFKIVGADAEPDDYFGSSVAISNNLAIVGAWGERDYDDTGAAYVFDVTTGQQLMKFTGYGEFGSSVALSGDIALVGAQWGFQTGDGVTGVAHFINTMTGQEIVGIAPSDSVGASVFGSVAALNNERALVGAPHDSLRTGAAYLFDVPTGSQLARLTAPDGFRGLEFGSSVALNSRLALVGAPSSGGGAAYLFIAVPEPNTLMMLLIAVLGGGVLIAPRRFWLDGRLHSA